MPTYRHVRTAHVETPTGERAKALADSPLWVEIGEGGPAEEIDPQPLPRNAAGGDVALPGEKPTANSSKSTAKK